MAATIERSDPGPVMCTVTGEVDRGRRVTFTPLRGGVLGGRVYSRLPIPADVGADGSMVAMVPSSAAVGPYLIRIGDTRYTRDVPNRASVKLADLLAAPAAES